MIYVFEKEIKSLTQLTQHTDAQFTGLGQYEYVLNCIKTIVGLKRMADNIPI